VNTKNATLSGAGKARSYFTRLKKDIIRNRYIYLMIIPVVLYYIIFKYWPMYGAQIAFRDYDLRKGIMGSEWVGFQNFRDFFDAYYFTRLLTNTILLSVYNLLIGFPAPIILALLLNEVTNKAFKRLVQTVTYLPHFISTVVICGIILDFLSSDGVVNNILNILGIDTIRFMIEPQWFRTVYVSSEIWQHVGWGTIIYLAALTNINPELYEACTIDGGGRFRKMISITLPGIAPTIIILLILRMGSIMNVGQEKVLLLYNPNIYETADIIQTFVYRKGLLEANYSYSSAIGLFNSCINFVLLVIVNKISKKVSETSLW
jgi:putative aldouronate transport system permease protein